MAITVIQAAPTVQAANLTGPVTATFGSPTTGGNTLVACVTTHGSTTDPAVSTITIGGAADNWQAAVTDPGSVQYGGAIWYDPNCAGGQTSVVLNCTGGVGASLPGVYLAVYEVSGVLVFDKGSNGDSSASVTTWTSGATATTTQANEIFVGVAMGGNALPTVTGVGTWNTQSTVAGNFDQISGTQIVSSTGTATFSGTQTTGPYIAIVATFSVAGGGGGAVTQVGTPAATAVQTANNTGSVTGSWSGTQPRTAGDLLVARVTAYGTTSATAISGTAGWTQAVSVTGSGLIETSVWTTTAAGADAAPTFTATMVGTIANEKMTCELTELTGQNAATPVATTGTASGTTGAGSVTSLANVPAAGCYGLYVLSVALSTVTTTTMSTGSGWSNIANDGATSVKDHVMFDDFAGPTAGATVTDATSCTGTEAFWSAALIVVQPPSAAPASSMLPLAPGWHPGAGLPGLPGGTPFQVAPQPAGPAGFTVGAAATLAGAGSLTTAVVQDTGTATVLNGAGSLTARVTLAVPATLNGAGSLTARDVTQGGTVTLAGAGSLDGPGCCPGRRSGP